MSNDKMLAQGAVGTPEWCEKAKIKNEVTGEFQHKDPKTGFLEKRSQLGFNAAKKARFIELFAQDALTIFEMCKAVGISRPAVYSAIAVDPEFRRQYIEIDEGHTDEVEKVLRNNAKTNKMASAERIFYLKKKRPQIYADKITIEQGKEEDIVKRLAARMADYQLIPKESIVEARIEEDNA